MNQDEQALGGCLRGLARAAGERIWHLQCVSHKLIHQKGEFVDKGWQFRVSVHRKGDFVDRLWRQEKEGWVEVGDGGRIWIDQRRDTKWFDI